MREEEGFQILFDDNWLEEYEIENIVISKDSPDCKSKIEGKTLLFLSINVKK